MNQTEAIKKAEDRLNLCIHISECSENKGRDKRMCSMTRRDYTNAEGYICPTENSAVRGKEKGDGLSRMD